MNKPSLLLPALACAALVHLGTVAAQEPAQRTAQKIEAISGGVGEDDARSMREMAPRFSLGLSFAGPRGEYLTDVDVVVENRAGKVVFSTVSRGPMLLIDLPSGSYVVEASFRGETLRRRVVVDKREHRALQLNWHDPEQIPRPTGTPPPEPGNQG